MGNRGAGLVAIGALVSIYGYLSAKMLGMPRLTFALAKGGDLPGVFGAVSRRFHTPWFSILFYSAAVWGLAIVGSFAWNVTLSVVARLFYYGMVCAALIALRRKQPLAAAFRLPGGPLLAVLGVGISVALATQVDLSKSLILGATVAAALLNWLWARRAVVAE
jgi:amino acid transporter